MSMQNDLIHCMKGRFLLMHRRTYIDYLFSRYRREYGGLVLTWLFAPIETLDYCKQ